MSESRNIMRTVLSWDRAINLADPDTNLTKYLSTRDMSHLRFHAGKKPMVFHLRAISNRTASSVVMMGADNDQRMKAFRASVVRVENAKLQDGREPFDWQPEAQANLQASDAWTMTEAELDLFHFGQVLEVGEVARARTFLPPEIEDAYVLPPTSWQVLLRLKDLYAAVVGNAAASG